MSDIWLGLLSESLDIMFDIQPNICDERYMTQLAMWISEYYVGYWVRFFPNIDIWHLIFFHFMTYCLVWVEGECVGCRRHFFFSMSGLTYACRLAKFWWQLKSLDLTVKPTLWKGIYGRPVKKTTEKKQQKPRWVKDSKVLPVIVYWPWTMALGIMWCF